MRTTRVSEIEKSIIKTLSYADIFDFPMTLREIYKYYIGSKKIQKKDLRIVLDRMVDSRFINRSKHYYFLIGRENFIKIRNERSLVSQAKWNIARIASQSLRKIPSVQVIGVSGSLSVGNCKKTDDIDFFIISKKNTLWVTRFLVNLTLFLIGYKRSRTDSFGVDMICPNMFISEDSLSISFPRQNIFSSHEVAQLKVLVNKGGVYEEFMKRNGWIKKYLPNITFYRTGRKRHKEHLLTNLFFGVLKIINILFYLAQYIYMFRRITNEEVKFNIARFHPKDKSLFVKQIYELRYKNYLLTFAHKLNTGAKTTILTA